MIRPALLLLALLLIGMRPAAADFAALNRTLVEDHVIPGYQALAEASARLEASLSDDCTADAKVLDAFHGTLEAWASIRPVSFGPITYLSRDSRFQFWPDKNSTLSKQLRKAIAERAARLLTPDGLAKASVALQGLPALERLLTADQDAEAEEAAYRCALARGIAANVAGMAKGVLGDWRGSYAALIEKADRDAELFEDSAEVTGLFLRGLDQALLSADELRLGRPLGQSLARARPRRAEAWRSERSLPMLRAVLGTLQAMAEPFAARAKSPSLNDHLAAAVAQAEAIEMPLHRAVTDSTQRAAVERLRESIRAARAVLVGEVAPALGLSVGFNALDGD